MDARHLSPRASAEHEVICHDAMRHLATNGDGGAWRAFSQLPGRQDVVSDASAPARGHAAYGDCKRRRRLAAQRALVARDQLELYEACADASAMHTL